MKEVNRVRGKTKNILWLSLIAMILGTVLVNVGISAKPPRIAVLEISPETIPASGLGHPGDEYTLSINVDRVTNLWTVGFEIHFRPFASVLVASQLTEGPFLKEGWDWSGSTSFAKSIDTLNGIIFASITRMPEPFTNRKEGISGDGTVMTFKLTVLEAGDSPIDLVNTMLIDPDGNPIPHKASSSKYLGPTAVLADASQGAIHIDDVVAGETLNIGSKVTNNGDIPLYVRVRFDFDRAEDGRRIVIRAGQNYAGGGLGEPLPFEYLYLDEFNEWFYEWNNPATNALGTPDGAYIEGDVDAQWASLYSFEDISLAGREIDNIQIEGYSQYPNGATEAVDIDLYGFSSAQGFAWLGSNFGTAAWGWHGVRWIGADRVSDVMPELRDETELNNMELLIYNYVGNAPDVIRVDSMRLRVEFAAITPVIPGYFEVLPGETLDLDDVTWPSNLDHVGSYTVSATVEYTSDFSHWNSWGAEPETETFAIKEA